MMTIGVIGLGLIGGSMAKAFKYQGIETEDKISCPQDSETRVLGNDSDESAFRLARLTGTVDDRLTRDNAKECDYIFLTVYPGTAVSYLEEWGPVIDPHTVVIDCCGIKRKVCEAGFAAAEKYGFTFIGGHPMAGLHEWGFKYAREGLYRGASMILVPKDTKDVALLARVSDLMKSIGFGSVTITTAEQHDKTIAFTSQLAHVVSNAYVKSPEAKVHKGFSAGSYRDLTRVAKLNEVMWTELFLDNKDNLKAEIDGMIKELSLYSKALEEEDAETLQALLKEGRERKERIDS